MKSAKILITLFAAGTLGAVALACTVSSGTDPDTNGGTSSGTNGTSSSSSSSSGTSGTADSGNDGAPADLCPALPAQIGIDSEACDTCLRTSCCDSTAACWTVENQGDLLGCEDYQKTLVECDDSTSVEPNECKRLTKGGTVDGIPAKYDTYLSCRLTSCSAACESVSNAPDAGTAQ